MPTTSAQEPHPIPIVGNPRFSDGLVGDPLSLTCSGSPRPLPSMRGCAAQGCGWRGNLSAASLHQGLLLTLHIERWDDDRGVSPPSC